MFYPFRTGVGIVVLSHLEEGSSGPCSGVVCRVLLTEVFLGELTLESVLDWGSEVCGDSGGDSVKDLGATESLGAVD